MDKMGCVIAGTTYCKVFHEWMRFVWLYSPSIGKIGGEFWRFAVSTEALPVHVKGCIHRNTTASDPAASRNRQQ